MDAHLGTDDDAVLIHGPFSSHRRYLPVVSFSCVSVPIMERKRPVDELHNRGSLPHASQEQQLAPGLHW